MVVGKVFGFRGIGQPGQVCSRECQNRAHYKVMPLRGIQEANRRVKSFLAKEVDSVDLLGDLVGP